MSFFWHITPITDRSKDQGKLITPTPTSDRIKDKGKPQRDRNREQDKIDTREGAANLHFNNYYNSLQNEHMHLPSSDSSPPLIILEKSKHSKNKKKKSRSETSREQNSRSNSRANGSDSDNESSKEATNSTNLTSLLAESNIHTGLNEAAVSPSKGAFLVLFPSLKIPGQMSLNAQLHTPINTVMITLTSQLIILFTLLMMIPLNSKGQLQKQVILIRSGKSLRHPTSDKLYKLE
jgi:hypothetical protein